MTVSEILDDWDDKSLGKNVAFFSHFFGLTALFVN